jgi:hypothetical protein
MFFGTASDALSYGLTSSQPVRSSSVPGTSASAPRGSQRSRACNDACPCHSRSFSEPARHAPSLTSKHGFAAEGVGSALRHRRDVSTPPPLPPPLPCCHVGAARCSSGGGNHADHSYMAGTFSSLQRADGGLVPFDYLRRGEGITGQRYPSCPPSRESLRQSPTLSPSSFFLDSFHPQRELEERCCYPSPPHRVQQSMRQRETPSRATPGTTSSRHHHHHPSAAEAAENDATDAREGASASSHGRRHSRHLHDHDERLTEAEHSEKCAVRSDFHGPSSHHRHHRHHRSDSRDHHDHHCHPCRPLSRHSSSAAARHASVTPSHPSPPPLLNAAEQTPAHRSQVSCGEATHDAQPKNSPSRLRQELLGVAVQTTGARATQPLDSTPPRASRVSQPASPKEAAHSLSYAIARVRAEVSKGAAPQQTLSAMQDKDVRANTEEKANVKSVDLRPRAAETKVTTSSPQCVGATHFSSFPKPTSTAMASPVENVLTGEPARLHSRTQSHRSADLNKPNELAPRGGKGNCSSSSDLPEGDVRMRSDAGDHQQLLSPRNSSAADKTRVPLKSATVPRGKLKPRGDAHAYSSASAGPDRHRTSLHHSLAALHVASTSSCSSPVSRRSPSSSSSSSVELHRAVQEAEAILQRMRQRGRRHVDGTAAQHMEKSLTPTQDEPSRSLSHTSAEQDNELVAATQRDRRRRLRSPHTGSATQSMDIIDTAALHKEEVNVSLQGRPPSHRHGDQPAPQSSVPYTADIAGPSEHCSPSPLAVAAAAAAEDAVRSFAVDLKATMERRQEDWCAEHGRRIERLREGLSSLCAAVRKDLRRVQEEVNDVRLQSTEAIARVTAAPNSTAHSALHSSLMASRTGQPCADAFPPECVVTWVAQCSPADQRRLAQLLLPHLRPALTEAIKNEMQHQLQAANAEWCGQLRELEGRMRAYVDEAMETARQRTAMTSSDGSNGGNCGEVAPLWAEFSSADAFNAHLRATARAVLVEEDDRRYSLANENERRHELRVRALQRQWEETLREAQLAWREEWRSMLDKAGEGWRRRAQAPLQKHADLLQTIVTALTKDVSDLHERQDAQAAAVQSAFEKEREMRQRENARLSDRVEQQVRQLLPREVESACVRYHVRRDRTAAAELRSAHATHGGSGGQTPATPLAHDSREEEVRLSVVQPALEHMRRLLVAHQDMVDAVVEDRCRRAEGAVEGSRHVWLQNVAELRSSVSSLRTDVRGAFHELCSRLNVSSPAL